MIQELRISVTFRNDLKYVLIYPCWATIPDQGHQCGAPRQQDVSSVDSILLGQGSCISIKIGTGIPHILDAYNRITCVLPLILAEAKAVDERRNFAERTIGPFWRCVSTTHSRDPSGN